MLGVRKDEVEGEILFRLSTPDEEEEEEEEEGEEEAARFYGS